MLPNRSTLALLAFASSAMAHPHRSHHHPYSTGAPYPYASANSTQPNGTAYATGAAISQQYTSTFSFTSTVLQTVEVTVLPIAASSSDSAADYAVGATDVAAVTGVAAATGSSICSTRSTFTSTFTDRVTVTIQPTSAVDAAATSKASVCTKKPKSSAAAVSVAPTSSVTPAYSPAPSSSPAESSAAPASSVQAEAYTKKKSSKLTSATPVSSAAASSYVAPASSTPAAVSAVASATPTYSSGTGKRGLSFNDVSLTKAFIGKPKISWAYNWGQTATGLDSSFEYVPMLWSTRSDFTNNWSKNAKAAIAAGSKHLLSFNEPDLAAQANMSPSDAATGYKTYMQPFKSSNPDVRLGSPAVTNGGNGMGLDWLSSFMTSCSGCSIDFVAIHWYDSASNVDYFKSHVKEAYTKTNKPVWITEFGASGSDSEVATFLSEVLPWLDSQDYVERYSYFMCSSGKLVSGTGLSTYGTTYASA